jgi:sigma-B regulation protein RsbU (phosphoserine phosphatase)
MTSLTTRLVLLLTLTIALTLTAITVADYLTSRDRILVAQEKKVEATVDAAVRDLEVRLSVLEETAHLLAEVIENGNYSEAELQNLLREAVDERDDLFGAALALHPRFASNQAEGFAPYYFYRDSEIVHVNLAQDYDYMLSSWFRDPLSAGKAVWTEPYFDEGGGNVSMVTYSVPMFREVLGEQYLYGVVTADITLDELQYYLQRMELGERGFGFMLSRSGKVMASPEPGDWLQSWARTISSPGEAERWASIVSRVTAGEAASAVVGCLDGPDDCVIKLAPLESTRWPVGAYYAEREILAPLRDYLTKSVLSQLLTLVLLLVGIIWVSRRITRPLTSLASATGDIATGNFHTPLPETRSKDELGQLVRAFSLMQERLQDYVDQLQAETASRNRLLGELEAATAIQMSMLPSRGQARVVEDRFKLWANLRPAKSVGGDLFTFHAEGPRRLFLAVGDVSDKGVPAALFMARAMTLLQQYVFSPLDASEVMAQLNDQLVEGNENYMFVTLFIGWLELESLELGFASGGHTPLSLSRNGEVGSLEQETGPALGLAEDQVFPLNRIQLVPGDQVAIFTDGIDEAFNADRQQFGLDTVNRVLAENSGQSLEAVGKALLDAVDAHQGEVQQSDDITLMLLELRQAGSERTRITLTDDPGAVSTLQAWMVQLLGEAEIGLSDQAEMQLVAEEVVTNVFKYGRLAEDQGVTLNLEIGDKAVRMEFRDVGIPFDPLAEAARSDLGHDIESAAIGGLGVHLLEGLTDEQQYQRVEGENRLVLVKQLR